ncbi:MAG: hypothetical protein ACJAY2_000099, partial [Pseudomonadales bacterium]
KKSKYTGQGPLSSAKNRAYRRGSRPTTYIRRLGLSAYLYDFKVFLFTHRKNLTILAFSQSTLVQDILAIGYYAHRLQGIAVTPSISLP